MTTFFTSDTHFSHARICELANRPFNDVDHMNAEIVKRWNTLVMPEDTVFHLGDVALGPIDQSLAQVSLLNGHKILVNDGNHDRPFMSRGKAKYQYWYDRYAEVFQEIVPAGLLGIDKGFVVNVSHFPYDGDSHGADRYAKDRLPDEGRILIHGHSHSEFEKLGIDSRVSRSRVRKTLQIHVGMDAWSFRPVSEAEVVELIVAHR